MLISVVSWLVVTAFTVIFICIGLRFQQVLRTLIIGGLATNKERIARGQKPTYYRIVRTAKHQRAMEVKVANLAHCGLKLAAPFTNKVFVDWYTLDPRAEETYNGMLATLGMEHDEEPYSFHCDSYYMFDTECIEDQGTYTPVLERISAISQGELIFSDFEDHLDWDGGVSWLSFRCNAKPVKVEFMQDDDWFNENVYDCVVKLMREMVSERRFFTRNTGDQTIEFGYLLPEQIEGLKRLGLLLYVF